MARGIGRSPLVRKTETALAVAGLLALLVVPLSFNALDLIPADFRADTWFIKHQADALRHDLAPSLFLHANDETFYPVFAFYGGTLFTIGGLIALLVGSAVAAQVILYLLALGSVYGGWLWLARLAGVQGWAAHAPAVVYVTAPLVVTNIYVRQDLAESVAAAAIPPLLASALSVMRADRLHAGPAIALALATLVVGGSHNLTMLWGVTILGVVGLVLAIAVPEARRSVSRRGVLRVLAIAVPAFAVDAWYLLPDLAYHSQTVIVQRIEEWKALLRGPSPVLDLKYLLSLGRPSPYPGSGLTGTLPVLAVAWVLAVAVASHARRRDAWARVLMVLSVATVVLLLVLSHAELLLVLPEPWQMLQFSYRLETFALFGICGAMIAGLRLLDGSRRRLTVLLVPILAFGVVGTARQIRDVPTGTFAPYLDIDGFITFSLGDFADGTLKALVPGSTRTGERTLVLGRKDIDGDRAELTLPVEPRDVLYSNLLVPRQMIEVQGAHVVGRWQAVPLGEGWQPRWNLALKVDDDARPGKAHIVIKEARTLPIVGGRVLSVLGLLGLAANAAVIARAGWRRRRAAAAA